jgi:endo-1,4-beta-xylanase
MRPSQFEYNYKQLDAIVDYAQANNMQIQSHHYVWGEEKWLPSWLKEGKFTPEEIKTIIKEHILNVGTHYKGKIKEWTVVNEVFTRNMHLYGLRDWWTDAIGDISFVDDSFRWARQADPDAVLILNDFGNESINDVSNVIYDYIKGAKERGVPIDGIGMQMHIDGTHPPLKDEVISNMKRFAKLGVKIYVTEFDVNMNDVKASSKQKNEIEGQIYYDMMRACIESKVCHSFAFLGITDAETWYNYMNIPDARPLMFDKDYNAKPAYFGIKRALQEK